jgi:hypothetical protein
MRQKRVPMLRSGEVPAPYWGARAFGLESCGLFSQLDESGRRLALHYASQGLLQETRMIEEMGCGFAGKMSTLVESREEKILYGVLAGEEAAHYYSISTFCEAETEKSEFAQAVEVLAASVDPFVLVFAMQVVLEGWAVIYYKGLMDSCDQPELQQALAMIVRDEVRHHATGLSVHRARKFSAQARVAAEDVLARLLRMFQIGPENIVRSIERVAGHLSMVQRARVFAELGSESQSHAKLSKIRSLMIQSGESGIVERLENLGCFRPFSPQECAEALSS